MEQTPSSPGRSPELPSVSPPSNGEAIGGGITLETGDSGIFERQEQRGESTPVNSPAQAIAVPIPMPATPVARPSVAADDSTAVTSLPSVAGDDDLIEKEWVDKAKKVLAETKDDPYRREQEVKRLQSDYLLKRYGRELGSVQ